MSYPNRFKGLKYINVNILRTTFIAGCILNILLAIAVLSVVGVFIFITSTSDASPLENTISSHPTVVMNLSTLTPVPTSTIWPTPTIGPTPTPWPTLTPGPTNTPIPTLSPLPTSTPFTLTIVLAQPSPTPTRLYDLGELLAGAVRPLLISEYKYGFYRALPLDGQPRIEPRIVGLPQIVQGLHWRLWNDYGWFADTSDEKSFEDAYSENVTFFLSSDPSQYHLALFYYDQQVSDHVLLDFVGEPIQVIYLPAARASPGFAFLPGPNGAVSITQTQMISASVR